MRKQMLSVFAILLLAPALSALAAGEAAAPAPTVPEVVEPVPFELTLLSGCTATYDQCGNGCGSIECSGDVSCSVGAGYVECDGERTYCPGSCYICAEMIPCDDGSRLSCQGTSYCSSAFGCWVHCDHQTQYCPGALSDPSCPAVN